MIDDNQDLKVTLVADMNMYTGKGEFAWSLHFWKNIQIVTKMRSIVVKVYFLTKLCVYVCTFVFVWFFIWITVLHATKQMHIIHFERINFNHTVCMTLRVHLSTYT